MGTVHPYRDRDTVTYEINWTVRSSIPWLLMTESRPSVSRVLAVSSGIPPEPELTMRAALGQKHAINSIATTLVQSKASSCLLNDPLRAY
jgi:hypothetical protein